MKKSLLLILLFFLVTTTAVAQNSSPSKHLLTTNLGIYPLGLNVSYDYVLDRVGNVDFTIGGQLGYGWNMIDSHEVGVGIRSTCRVKLNKWTIYQGITLGGGAVISSYIYIVDSYSYYYYYRPIIGVFSLSLVSGASYDVTPKLALNLEANCGLALAFIDYEVLTVMGSISNSYFNFGLIFKL